jgi:hypothetical protein
MNQIVNTLISALGFERRSRAANDLRSDAYSPMTELRGASLAFVVGGDGDAVAGGPRGGWKASSTSTVS